MKKLFMLLGIIILSGVIFGGGMVIGARLDLLNTLVGSSILAEDISKASTTLVLLRNLENEKIEEAKSFLNLQLDCTIIGMASVLPHCPDGDNTRAAKKLIFEIEKHRQEYPSQTNNSRVDEKVKSILETALKE